MSPRTALLSSILTCAHNTAARKHCCNSTVVLFAGGHNYSTGVLDSVHTALAAGMDSDCRYPGRARKSPGQHAPLLHPSSKNALHVVLLFPLFLASVLRRWWLAIAAAIIHAADVHRLQLLLIDHVGGLYCIPPHHTTTIGDALYGQPRHGTELPEQHRCYARRQSADKTLHHPDAAWVCRQAKQCSSCTCTHTHTHTHTHTYTHTLTHAHTHTTTTTMGDENGSRGGRRPCSCVYHC